MPPCSFLHSLSIYIVLLQNTDPFFEILGYTVEMETTHVFPLDDLLPHTTEGHDGQLDCNPRKVILENGNMVVIHRSYDGREIFEQMENRYVKYFQ
jgi:hypothetical protein